MRSVPLLLPLATCRLAGARPPPPNVVVVLSDDQGWADIGYMNDLRFQYQPGAGGGTWIPNPPSTPHLDEMAKGPHSVLFHRFYSGSSICSPTRSALLTGRTPDRECIFNAQGCGQMPAWSCNDPLPFPPTVFTVAHAARAAGMRTIHIGKWHLGNFFPMPPGKKQPSFAAAKWPVSHPGMHGFDEWHSTEASASSSMCNCGCDASWVREGAGCVTGGGKFQHSSFRCTNYWSPSERGAEASCLQANSSSRACVANLTSKIQGDDTEYIMDTFERFLQRQVAARRRFLAQLWLHTVHEPHPAMPQWYHAYKDAFGKPAGDYLGTISQMDAQIGRLRAMLRHYGVANDTLLLFTADNGPHPGKDVARSDVRSGTNGLRQCKASFFEGGIRVPGILEWPSGVSRHLEVHTPVIVQDLMPTILELFGQPHPHPDWAMDGESLVPLLSNATAQRSKALGFRLLGQLAWITADGRYKLLYRPATGQCPLESSTYLMQGGKKRPGPFLFDLHADPTESNPINEQQPQLLQQLVADMNLWAKGLRHSQQYESQCLPHKS